MSTLVQAIRMEHPDTIPVSVGLLPAMWIKYGSELQRLVDQYPQFFHGMKMDLDHIEDHLAPSYRQGVYFDEWNCECVCGGVNGFGRGVGKTKAKKKAAYMVLVRLLKAAGICEESWEKKMWEGFVTQS